MVGSRGRPSPPFPLGGRGIEAGTGLEQGWQFFLVVMVKVGVGGHQVEQILIAGSFQLLGVVGRLCGQLGGENRVSTGNPGPLRSFQGQPNSRRDSNIIETPDTILKILHNVSCLKFSSGIYIHLK